MNMHSCRQPMNSCRKGRRSQSNRKKISDTTGLSLFIRQPPPEQTSARARNRCGTGAMAPRGRSSGVRVVPEQRSAPSSAPKIQESGPVGMNSSVTALVRQDADVDAILSRGGLRLMQNMSVYLTRDEQIIFADLSSGMAALVTGVSKVGDTELAIISGACVGRCAGLNLQVNAPILSPRRLHITWVTHPTYSHTRWFAEAQKAIQGAAAAPSQQPHPTAGHDHTPPISGPLLPADTKLNATVSVKAEADADPGIGTLEGALAGLLALKNSQVCSCKAVAITCVRLAAHPSQA